MQQSVSSTARWEGFRQGSLPITFTRQELPIDNYTVDPSNAAIPDPDSRAEA